MKNLKFSKTEAPEFEKVLKIRVNDYFKQNNKANRGMAI